MKLRSIPVVVAMLGAITYSNATMAQKKAPASKPKAAASQPVKLTEVEGISEYVLPNGLHVLLFPDQSKPSITVNITYLVGSRMEGYGETGMAHLLEHMMFKGSKNHPHVPDELTAHGANPNGTTSYDRTNYFETFQANDENLNWALSLESDRMVNSFIAEKDLRSEFSVVRNEFESGENSPSNILMERVLSTMYLWHNYGKATIGSKEDIEKVSIPSLQAFYKKYYQPDNAVLLVAGKIDQTKTLALVAKYFGGIPKPSRVIEPTYTIEPAQDGERSVELRRVGDVQSVSCGYHIVAGSDADFATFDVLSDVLTNEPDGRLYKALVKTGLATQVWAWAAGQKDPGFLYINADVLKTRSADSVHDVLYSTISDIKRNPITQEELDNAKNKLLKNFDETYRNTEYIGLTLSEYIAEGDWRLAFIYRDNLKKVTAEDLNRIAKKYLIKSNRTSGIFIPTANPIRAEIPNPPDVATLVKDYKGQAALAQAEAFDISPDNIEKRTERGAIGSAKYALLAKSTRGNTVEARITLRIGDATSLQNKATVASLTAEMLKRGTKTMTMAQINEALDKLSSSVYIYGSGQNVGVIIKSVKNNLAATLDLVNEMLHQPAFSDDEFKTLKNEDISNLEQQKSEPQSIAFLAYSRIMSPYAKGDIRYNMTVEEQEAAINNTTAEDVRSFYKDFYNGENATIAFVGDFDAAMVKSKLNGMVSGWVSPKKYAKIHEQYFDVAAQDQEIKTPDKKNAMMVCGMNLKLNDNDPDYAALNFGDFMFGGGFLNSRLAMRIRQKEGISYGVGSFIRADNEDESGFFMSYAIYNPDNKAKLQTVWIEEMDKLLKDGFTDEELKKARTGYLEYRQNSRADDGQLADKLNSYLEVNRTLERDKKIDAKLETISLADINKAMKRFLATEKITFVKAGDFK